MDGKLYGFLGKGVPYFTTEGTTLKDTLKKIIEKANKKMGYSNIITPEIVPNSLLKRTGHDRFYALDTYSISEEYSLKPMNCPGFVAMLLQKGDILEQELPIKYAEIEGKVARTEWDCTLNDTLKRLHIFTQDDSHALASSEEEASQIVNKNLRIMLEIYKIFGFDFNSNNFKIVITKGKPKESLGTSKEWEKSESVLRNCLEQAKKEKIIPEFEDDIYQAAFYGPKINFNILNSENEWVQCGTIQLDNQIPKNVGLAYLGEDGKKHTPVMVHRAILGSYERFISLLMEKYEKNFPIWLSPVKARILPRDKNEINDSEIISKELYKNGIITEIDYSQKTISEKIQDLKDDEKHFFVPYTIQIGEKGKIVVTDRKDNKTRIMDIGSFASELLKEELQMNNVLDSQEER